MNTTTFSKSCDIQDNTAFLCDGPVDDNNVCVQDMSSQYYKSFLGLKYPKEICENSCGPFVNNLYNFEPLLKSILKNVVIKWIWIIFFESTYVPWGVIVLLAVLVGNRKNTAKTLTKSSTRKIKTMEVNLMKLKADCRKQEKTIARLKIVGDKSHITND